MGKESHELCTIICQGPKELLLEYTKKNEPDNIRNLIAEHPTILNESYGHPYYKPILYIACFELANQVSADTVATLIKSGADLHFSNKDTSNKEAIHFAVCGENPNILKEIVKNIKDKEKINSTAENSTALNWLLNSEHVGTENFNECLNILLKSGINVNKANRQNITPILWASYKGYREVVSAILDCGRYVDIDSHELRKKSARTYIEEKKLYDKPLPLKMVDSNENNVNLSVKYVEEYKEDEFLQLENVNVNDEIEEGTLLQLACERNLVRVVEKLLENGADVHKRTIKNREYPLEIVAKKGYHKIFKLLIEKYPQKLPQNILTLLLKYAIADVKNEEINYDECLITLLDQKKDITVNDLSDTGNTPLHYVTGFRDEAITLKLLERGASLANPNKFNCLPIEDVDSRTLEAHFDNCVKIKQSKYQSKTDKQTLIVSFDYKNLFQTSNLGKSKRDKEYESDSLQEHPEPMSETGVIYVMSKIPEMHHLLVHPLISSFIYMKWQRLRWFFRLNLSLFILFSLFLITYIFLPDDGNFKKDNKALISFVWIVLLIAYVLLILREALQMIFSITTYFCSLANLLETVMLSICFYVIFFKSPELLYKQLSSISMVLLALEGMVLLGQHPRMSTNIVMLRTVTRNFFLFLAWYSLLILAFVLCFYKLFRKETNSIKTSNSTEPKDEEQDFFVEPGLTFIKTIVMLTGEFDASSLNFDSLANKIIFLMFVFMVPIILFNLLNGLAISDTQIIKNDAEIMGCIERINYIVYIENIMLGTSLPKSLLCLLQQYRACCQPNENFKKFLMPRKLREQISLFPYRLPEKKIDVLLYRNGKIVEVREDGESCFRDCKALHIDKKTIKRVKSLLFEQNRKLEETQRINELKATIEFQRKLITELQNANKHQ